MSKRLNSHIFTKVPPQNIELEQAVLGAIMLEKDKLDDVLGILGADDFYEPKHQVVFKAIETLNAKGIAVDILTVSDELSKTNQLENAGGNYYLTRLTVNVISSSSAIQHAYIVKEKSINRSLIRIGGDAIRKAYDDEDCFENIDFIESEMFKIGLAGIGTGFTTLSDSTMEVVKQIDDLRAKKISLTGIGTGFTTLDSKTGGWQKSDLVILAARPGMGKTSFALQLALSASENIPVGFFSLEMSVHQITQRLLANVSGVHLEKIKRGTVADYEQDGINNAHEIMNNRQIFFDETAGINIAQFKAKARHLVAKKGVKLILVDYLQLMRSPGAANKSGNREQEISTISRELKATAKELNVPIISLSQLSRSVEARANKLPMLSDLRESGAIEQDADMVMFLHRPAYYSDTNEMGSSIGGDNDETVNLIIAKHRNGSLETLPMMARLYCQQWTDNEFKSLININRTNLAPYSSAIKNYYEIDKETPF